MNAGPNRSLPAFGLLAAIGSSLCCIVPAIAALLSISGVAASFSWIAPLRPYLIGLAVISLGAAWYKQLKPAKVDSASCNCSEKNKQPFYATRSFLIGSTIFATLMLSFPSYSGVLFESNQIAVLDSYDDAIEVKLKVKGMSCGSCEASIEGALKKFKGIKQAVASYSDGLVVITYDPNKTSESKIKAYIEKETGFKVTGNA